ncbi:MAG: flagellar motor protein MotD [Proteobacteria bacterium]|nr:flagellar motor protein MotD [Pseudomonadota bacterium]
MQRRPRRHEEHTNHESWAIPYGDLVTLLLAFFVVMYAISSVNAGKYRVLSDSLYAAFRGAPRTAEPIEYGQKDSGATTDLQQHVFRGAHGLVPTVASATPPGPAIPAAVTAHSAALAQASAALAQVADDVERAMKDLVDRKVVTIRRNDLWIEVEIRADVLFPSGIAQLSPSAAGVISELSGVLAPLPNAVRVEGHTDNVPIRTAVFYSNWELSAARAGSVVRMLAAGGVAPQRLAVVGLGEEHPAQSNDTAQGRNANRRVVVVILSTGLTDQNSPLLGAPRPSIGPQDVPPPPAAAAAGNGTDHAP